MRRIAVLLLLLHAAPLFAQEDRDKPSFKVGALIFADYTYTQEPTTRDADGNEIHPSAFNVSRAYINVTGSLNHWISFRVTPDIARETSGSSSLSGSQEYRLKYAWAQFNLDDWLTKGSFLRAGLVETPFIPFEESIYRYRFQGTIMVDREGLMTAADYGGAFHYNFRSDYGDVYAGVFNGEGYQRAEANDQKAFEVRATVRPLPRGGIARGLRLTGYVQRDHYVEHGARNRTIAQATFEHPRVNAGVDVVRSADRRSAALPEADGRAWSAWVTPKLGHGWETLFRYDRVRPDRNVDGTKRRDIEGVAYWFPMMRGTNVTSAVLLDRDSLRGLGGPVTNYGVKVMISF
ncbi:MAG TPA: porin [Thermoanaerobaculia bacterium]|jgi:hypothetical protein